MKINVFAEKSGCVAAKIPLYCGVRWFLPEQKWIRDFAFGDFNGLTGRLCGLRSMSVAVFLRNVTEFLDNLCRRYASRMESCNVLFEDIYCYVAENV